MAVRDETARRRKRAGRAAVWAIIVALGTALWLHRAATDGSARPALGLLVDFLYFVPLAAGFSVWSAGLTLSKAKWADRLESILLKGHGCAVPSLIALAGVWMLSRRIGFGRADHGGAWLAPAWLFGRDAVALAFFWVVAMLHARRRREGSGSFTAAVLAVLYLAVFSLIGFDGAMSLTWPWKSTVFGLYFAVSGLYSAAAAWTLCSAIDPFVSKAQLHDLGKILVGMSLLSAYLMAAQLLTVWYADLPAETGFLVDRLRTAPWRATGAGLVASVYLGPLVLLLPAAFKRNRACLGAVAALVLAGMWCERCWLVVPAFRAAPVAGFPEVALAGAFIGALGMVYELTSVPDPARPERTGNPKAGSAS
jgi:hypothetical protein